jgi:hypothetical protein
MTRNDPARSSDSGERGGVSSPSLRPAGDAGRCAISLAADTHRTVGHPFHFQADAGARPGNGKADLPGRAYPGGTTVTVAVTVKPLAVSVAKPQENRFSIP